MPLKQKYTFQYEIYDSNVEEFPNQIITSEVEALTLTGLLETFQRHLESVGYVLLGNVRIVPDSAYIQNKDISISNMQVFKN